MNEITDSINVDHEQMSKLTFTTIQNKVFQCTNVVSVPSNSTDSTLFQ